MSNSQSIERMNKRRKSGIPALTAAAMGVGIFVCGTQLAHADDFYLGTDTGSGATQTGTGGTGVDGGWWWDPANWQDSFNANSHTPPNPTENTPITVDYNTSSIQPVLGLVYDPQDDPFLGTNSMTLTYTAGGTSDHLYLSSAGSNGTAVGNIFNSPATLTVDSGVLETYDAIIGRDGPGLLVQNGGDLSFIMTMQLGANHNNGPQNGTYDYTGGTLYQGYDLANQVWTSTGSSIGVRLGTSGSTGTFIDDNSGSLTGHAGAIVLDNYYSAYSANTTNTQLGITDFIYDGADNTGHGYAGGIVPIQVTGGDVQINGVAAEGQIALRNYGIAGSAPQFNSELELSLDAAPGLVPGTAGMVPQSLALFTYTNGVHGLSGGTEPAEFFYGTDDTVGLANGSTLTAVYGSNSYTWAIYYNGSVSFSNSATSQISSISQTGGNVAVGSAGAIVLIGVATTAPSLANGIWVATGGGNWSTAGNWSNDAIPGSNPGDTATFGSAIQSNSSIRADNETLGAVTFSNTFSYAINSDNGTGSLIMNNGTSAATITNSLGTHSINVPVQLVSNLDVSVANAGDNLTISGNVAGTGSLTLLSGSGTLTLSGSNSYSGGTTISAGTLAVGSANGLPSGTAVTNNSMLAILAGTSAAPVLTGNISGVGGLVIGTSNGTHGYLKLATGSHTSTVTSLVVNAGSVLDVANDTVAINYGSSANEAATVSAVKLALAAGYNAGAWTGTSGTSGVITSSTAAAGGSAPKLSVGYADGSADSGTAAVANQVIIKYTLAGDANLDGSVNFTDLGIVGQHLNTTGNDWAHGNFTYDPTGAVTFTDLGIVGQNLNKLLTPAGSSGEALGGSTLSLPATIQNTVAVPEPTTMGLAAAGIAGLLAWRRRSRRER